TAPSCDQAMLAIALVAALAARSQAERNAAAALDAGPDAAPPTELGSLDGGRTETAPAEPGPALNAEPKDKPSATDHDAMLEREVSAAVTLATGVGPGGAFGIALGGRLGLAGKMGRSIALSLRANDTFRRELAVADVRMRVIQGRLELCPFEPLLSGTVRLSPCPGFEAGSQSGRSYEDGERVAQSSSEARLWLAATVAARLRLQTGSLRVSFGPELIVPITKNSFFLSQPTELVYEVPDVAVGAEVSVGFAW
ncbi:MAG TPA: hypothetical protein VF103_08730, partial [Polyangiaceae bacterium]